MRRKVINDPNYDWSFSTVRVCLIGVLRSYLVQIPQEYSNNRIYQWPRWVARSIAYNGYPHQ